MNDVVLNEGAIIATLLDNQAQIRFLREESERMETHYKNQMQGCRTKIKNQRKQLKRNEKSFQKVKEKAKGYPHIKEKCKYRVACIKKDEIIQGLKNDIEAIQDGSDLKFDIIKRETKENNQLREENAHLENSLTAKEEMKQHITKEAQEKITALKAENEQNNNNWLNLTNSLKKELQELKNFNG